MPSNYGDKTRWKEAVGDRVFACPDCGFEIRCCYDPLSSDPGNGDTHSCQPRRVAKVDGMWLSTRTWRQCRWDWSFVEEYDKASVAEPNLDWKTWYGDQMSRWPNIPTGVFIHQTKEVTTMANVRTKKQAESKAVVLGKSTARWNNPTVHIVAETEWDGDTIEGARWECNTYASDRVAVWAYDEIPSDTVICEKCVRRLEERARKARLAKSPAVSSYFDATKRAKRVVLA